MYYVYFTQSYSEEDPSPEPGWELRADSSHEGDQLDEDWVPQATAHHIAMMAHKRGQVKETSHEGDGEESTSCDVESDDEITPRDERARRRVRDVPSAVPTTESS